jgi:hypothetical protein
MANTAANARSIVSLELSDVEVPLASLQRDLTAASDTFQLDHLDDSVPLPMYDASLEPDHVPSLASPQIREAVSSPRSAPSPVTSQPARADPNGHLATPARPWGLLRPPTAQAARHSPVFPRRAPATGSPIAMPRGSPTLPPWDPHTPVEQSGNMDLYEPGSGHPPQLHGMLRPYYPREERARVVSPSSRLLSRRTTEL